MMYADVAVRLAPYFGEFVGRNQEGRSGVRTAFDFASGLLEVVVRVLGGSAFPVREHVSWLLLMLQWRRRVVRG